MQIRKTELPLGAEATDEYDAVFNDGSKRRLDFMAVVLIKNQQFIKQPDNTEFDIGDPFWDVEFRGVDLQDGKFVDVSKDPGFKEYRRRID